MEILTRKGIAIQIDDADYELVSDYSWRVDSSGYARTTERGSRRELVMHRLIMKVESADQVDHIDQNRLNNRRSNLRLATNAQNQQNRSPNHGRAFKGVFRVTKKTSKPFFASVRQNGKNHYLGTYASEEEAARAYDQKARELFGEYAALNFP